MPSRRSFFTSLASFSLLPTLVAAQADTSWKTAFNALTETQRRSLQVELQMASLYTSTIDGVWGNNTYQALLSAPYLITRNSNNRHRFSLGTAQEKYDFALQVANGDWTRFLSPERQG